MFKVLDIRTNTDIVILSAEWIGRIADLRSFSRQDVLVCPGCLQPVYTRAGGIKRPHFAHKHLGACAYGQASPALLDARATLYEWLAGKFGDSVTLEKKIENEHLPRPIDCWVEQKSGSVAYWIIDVRMNPDKRDDLKQGFKPLDARVNWVFVVGMLREDATVTGGVHLTTTEREFIQPSDYDKPVQQYPYGLMGTLHYLDSHEQILTTFRGLHRIHEPQFYEGHRERNKLADVQVLAKTGEFVHPGEYERLQAYRQAESQAEQEQQGVRIKSPARVIDSVARMKRLAPMSRSAAGLQQSSTSDYSKTPQREEGTCLLCGKKTTDWWYFDGTTKMCKCHECLQKGLD
jgi:Competence protein CoiA-like family